jgi:hypothetical protein
MYVKSVYSSGVGDVGLGQTLSAARAPTLRVVASEPTRQGIVVVAKPSGFTRRMTAAQTSGFKRRLAAASRPRTPQYGPRPERPGGIVAALGPKFTLPRAQRTVVVSRPVVQPVVQFPAGSSSSPIDPGPSGSGGGAASYGGGATPGGGSKSYGGGDGGWPPSWADEGLIDETEAAAAAVTEPALGPEVAPAAPAKKPLSTKAKLGIAAAVGAAVLYAMYS